MSSAARVEALFFSSLEKGTASERATYLDAACAGDVELRRQVEKLLNAHLRVGDFLKKPAVERLVSELAPADGTQAFDASTDGQPAASAGNTGPTRTEDRHSEIEHSILTFLLASTWPDSLGRIGHYEVLEVLGKGGFGIVFRAFDETLQREVAVKVLAPHLAVTSPARKRFLREALSSAKVRHTHVVQIYAVEEQPLPYLVMEFIPGETLQQRIDRTGPLEAMEVVRIGREIAEGLAAAHAQGLIHRDIKPGNILLDPGTHPSVKITDFGLARAADDASLTQSGIVAGTPMFMAPEQALGEALDHRADLFSLGSVLYTMCSGRPPFRAKTTLAVLKRVAEDTPRPIREIIPEVPGWLCDIIARLHAKRPEDRYASARELVDLLGRCEAEMQRHGKVLASEESEPPVEVSPTERPRPPRGRKKLHWANAAAVFALLLGGLGVTEATGVTDVRGTVIRLVSPEGTLVVEVEDPGVSVLIDGSDLVITGAGVREIRLKPGRHTVEASKGGKVVRQELVTVAKNGRQVVRVSQEVPPADTKTTRAADKASTWERSVAVLPIVEQVKAVIARLQERNPGFDGKVTPTIENGVVTKFVFESTQVRDISPLRVFTRLRELHITRTQVSDLTPLRGMPLRYLNLYTTPVSDLSALEGMPLVELQLIGSQVADLSALKGMPLEVLYCSHTRVSDLSPLKGAPLRILWVNPQVSDLTPLKGMPLEHLGISDCKVSDLTPLKGMPLRILNVDKTQVSDLSPLEGMPLQEFRFTPNKITRGLEVLRAMKGLKIIGAGKEWPTAEFWARHAKGEFSK